MNEVTAIVATLVLGLIAFFVGRKAIGKPKKPKAPPENLAANAAKAAVQESFEEEVDRVRSATDGRNPGDDLADLGNARRRR